PAARDALAARCTCRSFRYHQETISREMETRGVFFVVSGSVRVVNWSYSGREVSFDDIHAGGTFGALDAIDGGARSASVIAREATTLGQVAPKIFMETVPNNPETARRLMEPLAGISGRSTERIFELSVFGANIRINADLLHKAEPNRRDDNSAAVSPIPIHPEIAAHVSTTRETVARVLDDLARRDIVIREKDRLIVPNVDALAEE
ncbi:MAG: Crp/Fnr family transcriptional regulator, partial [Alphaproteobacteria bacterium]